MCFQCYPRVLIFHKLKIKNFKNSKDNMEWDGDAYELFGAQSIIHFLLVIYHQKSKLFLANENLEKLRQKNPLLVPKILDILDITQMVGKSRASY